VGSGEDRRRVLGFAVVFIGITRRLQLWRCQPCRKLVTITVALHSGVAAEVGEAAGEADVAVGGVGVAADRQPTADLSSGGAVFLGVCCSGCVLHP